MDISHVDICCGLAWGDEAKGRLFLNLLKVENMISFVAGQEEIMLDILYMLIPLNIKLI